MVDSEGASYSKGALVSRMGLPMTIVNGGTVAISKCEMWTEPDQAQDKAIPH